MRGTEVVIPSFLEKKMLLESKFKKDTIRRISRKFSKLDLDFIDTSMYRSVPDTFIIAPYVWAALEFKRSEDAPQRPNQNHHIERLNRKGYASFVFPENVEEVLNDLEVLFLS